MATAFIRRHGPMCDAVGHNTEDYNITVGTQSTCRRCGLCDATIGHQTTVTTTTSNATCENSGTTQTKCTHCNTITGTGAIAAEGHDLYWYFPDNDVANYEDGYCVCRSTWTCEENHEPDHGLVATLVREESCTEDGVRDIYSPKYTANYNVQLNVPALGHNYTSESYEGALSDLCYINSCIRCGDSNPVNHDFGTDFKCKNCTRAMRFVGYVTATEMSDGGIVVDISNLGHNDFSCVVYTKKTSGGGIYSQVSTGTISPGSIGSVTVKKSTGDNKIYIRVTGVLDNGIGSASRNYDCSDSNYNFSFGFHS